MLDQLFTDRIVPVFYHDSPQVCEGVLRAVYEGGGRCFEFTNRGAAAPANFAHLARVAARDLPGMVLGIGTLLNPAEVAQFVAEGARFAVTPSLKISVGEACQAAGVPWIPGCMTLSEVHQALDAGADAVKIFPAEVVGPAFVRSVKTIFPTVRLMVTGGVLPTPQSLNTWFASGANAVGMGSQLIPQSVVEKEDFSAIQKVISSFSEWLT